MAYRALDTTNADVEVYLVERPFFNGPYLFVTVFIDNHGDELQYVRPDGLYWDGLTTLQKAALKTTPTYNPSVPVLGFDGVTPQGMKVTQYTPFDGTNHL